MMQNNSVVIEMVLDLELLLARKMEVSNCNVKSRGMRNRLICRFWTPAALDTIFSFIHYFYSTHIVHLGLNEHESAKKEVSGSIYLSRFRVIRRVQQ